MRRPAEPGGQSDGQGSAAQPAVEPRQLKVTGFSVDLGAVATDLESGIPDLRTAIDRLDKGRKEAEGSLVVKRKAISVLRRTILWVGRTTEGLFHLAGEDDLAERIRSSTRRPLRPSETAPAATVAEETVADEAGPADKPAAEPATAPAAP